VGIMAGVTRIGIVCKPEEFSAWPFLYIVEIMRGELVQG
jgi:hypothetical protein